MLRDAALTRRYIEANPQALTNLLVVDIDHADGAIRAIWDRPGFLPNFVIDPPPPRVERLLLLREALHPR